MSANDVLSANANFADWSKNRGAGLEQKGVKLFDYFCVDQFLKSYPPTDDEHILGGITGGGLDGGVDAIYFFINGKIVDDETIVPTDTAYRVNLVIFQVKETQGFSPIEVDKLFFFTDDILNLTVPASTFKGQYNQRLLDIMETFKTKFPTGSAEAEVYIDYYYVSKVDEENPHPNAVASSQRVLGKAKEHLSAAHCDFHFSNAAKLWAQIQRRRPKSRILQFVEVMETPEGRVGIVNLRDYYEFLRDDATDLINERIFDSNVRGYQQNTPVNLSIRKTLRNPGEAEFWLLNNGITILASKLSTQGFKSVKIEDPQVVNGLQSSREVFSVYKDGKTIPKNDNRRVLVRVIETTNSAVREEIVRATNSQNRMRPEALRATDPIHGYIEELFRANGLYYDRRPGKHKDDGRPINQIVSILGLLQTMMAIILQRPQDAYGAPGRYIREDNEYYSVFSQELHPPTLFLRSIQMQRKVDDYLDELDLDRGHRPRLRFYMAMFVTCLATKSSHPTKDLILDLNIASIDKKTLDDAYKQVNKRYSKAGGDNLAAKGPRIVQGLQRVLKKRFPNVAPSN